MPVKDIIQHASEKNVVGTRDAFQDEILGRVADVIAGKRIDVAQQVFNQVEYAEEPEEEQPEEETETEQEQEQSDEDV